MGPSDPYDVLMRTAILAGSPCLALLSMHVPWNILYLARDYDLMSPAERIVQAFYTVMSIAFAVSTVCLGVYCRVTASFRNTQFALLMGICTVGNITLSLCTLVVPTLYFSIVIAVALVVVEVANVSAPLIAVNAISVWLRIINDTFDCVAMFPGYHGFDGGAVPIQWFENFIGHLIGFFSYSCIELFVFAAVRFISRENLRSTRAAAMCKMVAKLVRRYDTDAIRLVLLKYEALGPAKYDADLLAAQRAVLANLEAFRPHIPPFLIERAAEEDSGSRNGGPAASYLNVSGGFSDSQRGAVVAFTNPPAAVGPPEQGFTATGNDHNNAPPPPAPPTVQTMLPKHVLEAAAAARINGGGRISPRAHMNLAIMAGQASTAMNSRAPPLVSFGRRAHSGRDLKVSSNRRGGAGGRTSSAKMQPFMRITDLAANAYRGRVAFGQVSLFQHAVASGALAPVWSVDHPPAAAVDPALSNSSRRASNAAMYASDLGVAFDQSGNCLSSPQAQADAAQADAKAWARHLCAAWDALVVVVFNLAERHQGSVFGSVGDGCVVTWNAARRTGNPASKACAFFLDLELAIDKLRSQHSTSGATSANAFGAVNIVSSVVSATSPVGASAAAFGPGFPNIMGAPAATPDGGSGGGPQSKARTASGDGVVVSGVVMNDENDDDDDGSDGACDASTNGPMPPSDATSAVSQLPCGPLVRGLNGGYSASSTANNSNVDSGSGGPRRGSTVPPGPASAVFTLGAGPPPELANLGLPLDILTRCAGEGGVDHAAAPQSSVIGNIPVEIAAPTIAAFASPPTLRRAGNLAHPPVDADGSAVVVTIDSQSPPAETCDTGLLAAHPGTSIGHIETGTSTAVHQTQRMGIPTTHALSRPTVDTATMNATQRLPDDPPTMLGKPHVSEYVQQQRDRASAIGISNNNNGGEPVVDAHLRRHNVLNGRHNAQGNNNASNNTVCRPVVLVVGSIAVRTAHCFFAGDSRRQQFTTIALSGFRHGMAQLEALAVEYARFVTAAIGGAAPLPSGAAQTGRSGGGIMTDPAVWSMPASPKVPPHEPRSAFSPTPSRIVPGALNNPSVMAYAPRSPTATQPPTPPSAMAPWGTTVTVVDATTYDLAVQWGHTFRPLALLASAAEDLQQPATSSPAPASHEKANGPGAATSAGGATAPPGATSQGSPSTLPPVDVQDGLFDLPPFLRLSGVPHPLLPPRTWRRHVAYELLPFAPLPGAPIDHQKSATDGVFAVPADAEWAFHLLGSPSPVAGSLSLQPPLGAVVNREGAALAPTVISRTRRSVLAGAVGAPATIMSASPPIGACADDGSLQGRDGSGLFKQQVAGDTSALDNRGGRAHGGLLDLDEVLEALRIAAAGDSAGAITHLRAFAAAAPAAPFGSASPGSAPDVVAGVAVATIGSRNRGDGVDPTPNGDPAKNTANTTTTHRRGSTSFVLPPTPSLQGQRPVPGETVSVGAIAHGTAAPRIPEIFFLRFIERRIGKVGTEYL